MSSLETGPVSGIVELDANDNEWDGGEAAVDLNEKRFALKKDGMIVMNPGIRHLVTSTDDTITWHIMVSQKVVASQQRDR